MARGQFWSVDALIAMSIFLVVALVFFSIISQDEQRALEEATQVAAELSDTLKTGSAAIVDEESREVNESKLVDYARQQYETTRSQLGSTKDFCVFFEDAEGNMVLINDSIRGFGSSDVTVGGQPCNSFA